MLPTASPKAANLSSGNGCVLNNNATLPSFLLVFGTGNLSEVLRGYYTKYDCSSGDINIIGSLLKNDIKSLLSFASKEFSGFEFLEAIENYGIAFNRSLDLYQDESVIEKGILPSTGGSFKIKINNTGNPIFQLQEIISFN